MPHVMGVPGVVYCLVLPSIRMSPQNHPMPINTSSNSFWICLVMLALALLSCTLFAPGRKYSISLFVSIVSESLIISCIGNKALNGLLFQFKLLPVLVQESASLSFLSWSFSRPVFVQHCSLPTLMAFLLFYCNSHPSPFSLCLLCYN